jgi:hypothetical protein
LLGPVLPVTRGLFAGSMSRTGSGAEPAPDTGSAGAGGGGGSGGAGGVICPCGAGCTKGTTLFDGASGAPDDGGGPPTGGGVSVSCIVLAN